MSAQAIMVEFLPLSCGGHGGFLCDGHVCESEDHARPPACLHSVGMVAY